MSSFIWLCMLLLPESPAVVRGRITDPSGAFVAGARVTAAGPQSAAASSDAAGRYEIELPQPGGYRLTVEAAGFRPFIREQVAAESRVLDVVLELAPLAEQVTITATAPPNRQEVLDIRDVRESFARDLGEALAHLDGLSKVRKGGIASDIVVRGFQRDNLAVILDGARVQGACPNRMDPPAFHVDFAEVSQVTVTKGPFDVREAGSLGGVVRVEPKIPEPGWRFAPSLAWGSFGYANPALTASFAAGSFSVLAGYSFRGADPFTDGAGRPFTSLTNYSAAGRAAEAFAISTGWARLSAQPRTGHTASLAYTIQNGGRALYPYLSMDAGYDRARRLTAAYEIADRTGALKAIRARAYLTRVRHWMSDELRTSAAGLAYSMATLAATRTLGARIEADIGELTAGLDVRRRAWNAATSMRMSGMYTSQPAIPNVAETAGGGFAEYHRALSGRLRLNAGARFDARGMEARNPAGAALYAAYQRAQRLERRDSGPSGHLWLSYTLPRDLELFAGAGRSLRFPDPQERYFALRRAGSDWVGSPNLDPTTNDEADLGLNFRGRHFSLRPTLFIARLSRYVALVNQPLLQPMPGVMNRAARSYANVDARLYGGELTWSVALPRPLLLSGGASYTRGEQTAPSANLSEMPPLRARASLRYTARRWFAEAEWLAVARQDRVVAALGEQPTAGYGVLNAKAGLHTRQLRFAVGLDNALNRFYYDAFSYLRDPFRSGVRIPEPGRSVSGGVTYEF